MYYAIHFQGTPIVEGISLGRKKDISEVDLSPTFFRSMYNLRLLKFDSYFGPVRIPQGLQYLPDTLTCLVWPSCPLKSLPLDFVPRCLIELKMPNSKLLQLWNGVHVCIGFSLFC